MNKRLLLTIAILSAIGTLSCHVAKNQTASFAGTHNATLEPGRKLISLSWNDGRLWILTRQATTNDSPEAYIFRETSIDNKAESKIVIFETR